MAQPPAAAPPTLVAPRGWTDLGDADEFFPDDLPEDWRLTYFANAFGAVLVPWTRWRDAPRETLAGWRDDVHGGFRFLLEAPCAAPAAASALPRAAAALGESLAAFVETAAGESADAPRPCRGRDLAPAGYAVVAPAGLLADPRAARRWLDEVIARHGAPPRAVLLERPRSAELAAWADLILLLGLDRPDRGPPRPEPT